MFRGEYQLIQVDGGALMMNIGFNQKFFVKKKRWEQLLNFSLLTRYLILNEVTGAVHQFRFQLDPDKEELFYPRPPTQLLDLRVDANSPFRKLNEFIFCEGDRRDTVRYIRWYIKYAYFSLGKKRDVLASADPYKDLLVMLEFWERGFNRQDTKVICLEVLQKFLFD